MAALTENLRETHTEATRAIIERIVSDIDEIVRLVRFLGWQSTSADEREVKQALRRTLLKSRIGGGKAVLLPAMPTPSLARAFRLLKSIISQRC